MTQINLKKSQFFLRDLEGIQVALKKLNKVDLIIQKILTACQTFLQDPEHVNSEELKSVLTLAQEIANNYQANKLSESLERLLDELDYLITSQSISFRTQAKLIESINLLYKLVAK